MAIANQIAQFGTGTAAGVYENMMANKARKEDVAYRNKMLERQAAQDKRQISADEDAYWTQAAQEIMSADISQQQGLWQRARETAKARGFDVSRDPPALDDSVRAALQAKATASAQTAGEKFGNSLTYTRDANGKIVAWQPSNRGGVYPVDFGGGEPILPTSNINYGAGTQIVDRAGTVIADVPRQVPPEQTPEHKGSVRGAEAEAAAAVPSEQTRAKARDKLRSVGIIKQQLSKVQSAFDNIKDSISAGPGGQGRLPTPGGQAFDAAVDLLRTYIRQMTRTPGEGAMSDFETKLAQAINPDRTKYETVTQQQIDQIMDLVDMIEGGYGEMKEGASATQAAPKQNKDDPLGLL